MVVLSGPQRLRSGAQQDATGYNLVALMVIVAVLNITVAAALPSVSQVIRREREAELVFRGLQYAEAIRVFQMRNDRYPTSLRELLETNPRCIRQLWTDPFNDSGEWGLILAQQPTAGRQLAPGADGFEDQERRTRRNERAARLRRGRGSRTQKQLEPRENVTERGRRGVPARGQVVARGPVIGVKSLSDEEAVRKFMGAESYNEWLFTVDLIPTLESGAVGENVPRLHTLWVGKPFPEGMEGAQAGSMPSDGRRRNPLDRRSGNRRNSSRERNPRE